MSVSYPLVCADGDLTDTISGPRSTASDLTSSKASTKSPTQRHNPFNEEQAETASSDSTPVHTTSQEKDEAQAPDQPDACTELEVIRSAGRGAGTSWGHRCTTENRHKALPPLSPRVSPTHCLDCLPLLASNPEFCASSRSRCVALVSLYLDM